VLAQFSKTIRPGDKAVKTSTILNDLGADDLHACATINDNNVLSVQLLNTTGNKISYQLEIKGQYAEIIINANTLQTVQIQL
jgi:glucosylceramidase